MYIITYIMEVKVPKTKSATELRASLFETLREVQEGEPQLVTHTKGSDGVILISQAKLNALLEENDTLKAIALGRADVAAGRTVSNGEATMRIKKMQAKWQK
ncbi:MAG: type II toxin-antitoxin system Phd/YefM family antitoxin [Deltaproteobacteria bacterium]|nr:type II toxin-antitoxin system Phd/YefM family antitoxin [Deltaproteobacteria bacterium]MBI3294085.1 type II toxin-antitoxin system Phd/YefM family antitoxin [Deltaproteobacteria bacterium]